ncbi:MAG: VCBS repeat-containing protein [Nanoarchaeota archaeon]|nr:VCBS repeat-containing protein [Nanoarchaeota archaeon]
MDYQPIRTFAGLTSLVIGLAACDANASKVTPTLTTQFSFTDEGTKGYGVKSGTSVQYLPIAAGDFDLDGLVDVVILDKLGNIHIHKNLGNENFKDVGVVGTVAVNADNLSLPSLAVADFNKDSQLDIAAVNMNGEIRIFYNKTVKD